MLTTKPSPTGPPDDPNQDRPRKEVPVRSRWRPRMRVVLTLYVALPVSLWIAFIGWGTMQVLTADWERTLEEDVELVGRALMHPVSRALERGDLVALEDILAATLAIQRVDAVSVYDVHAELVATFGEVEPDQPLAQTGELSAERVSRTYERFGDHPVFSFYVPLRDSSERFLGRLQVTRPQREMRDSLAERWRSALLTLLVGALGLAGLALWGHHRGLSRHLAALTTDMTRVGGGAHTHRSRVSGPREIEDLAQTLNHMLDQIACHEEEIAQRQKAEARLAERLRSAERLAALGRLCAGVAHELGTPLSVIDGYAQRLVRQHDLDRGQHRALTAIRTEVIRAEGIVRQLLEVGRNRSRAFHYHDPRRSLRVVQASISDSGLTPVPGYDLDQALPQVRMDPGRVEQALVNLVRNAIQAAGPSGQVRLRAWHQDELLHLAVEDDGPGISHDHRRQIFEPFYTTKAVGEGTGLGLAVVQSVVDEHQGSITVTRSSLGGACLTLSLPTDGPNNEPPGRERSPL